MPLSKLSIREIRSRPARSFLTLCSIVIGVAAIVATSLASNSARLAQMAIVRAVTGNTSIEIDAIGGTSFDATPLKTIAEMHGIQVASPMLRRYSSMTVVRDGDDQNTGDPKRYRVQLLGVVPHLDKQVRGYTLVAGKDLEDAASDNAAVLMDAGFAKSSDIAVGSTVRFLTKSYMQQATVVGLTKPTNVSDGLQSGLIVSDLKTVQRWSKAVGKLDAIQIVLDKEAKTEKVLDQLKSELPQGLNVRVPSMRSQLADESMVAPQQGLRLATGFALIISAFIIYNTFQMNVGERRRQLGILRSMGATRRQLLWMIVREGLWLGLVGTFLGCVVGHFGATILTKITAQLLQIDIPPNPWSILPYLIAACCGVLVAAVGAFFPALRASRLSPAEAMRVVASGEFATSRAGWLALGGTLIAVGIIVQVLSIQGLIDVSHSVPGALMMKMGFVFVLPAVLRELTAYVTWLLSFFLPTEGKLARRQILRHRSRSSLTIGVVFIAMGTGLGMASTILDHIHNVENWYKRAIVGDFFIRAAMPDMNSGQSADMPEGLPERVVEMPGVALVDTLRFVTARSNEKSLVVVVRKFNSTTQDYFDIVEGNESELMNGVRHGEVAVGSVLSQRLNLHAGDELPLETNDGSTSLKVAGVVNDYIAGGLTVYLEAEYAKKLLNVEGTDVIVIKAKDDKLVAVEKQLRDLCDENGMMFQSNVDLENIIHTTLNGFVGCLWAVLILGSIIAAFGLINTLAMNILEQTREIGMLRVVAMTRSQIRKMILSQALIMGLIGIVPGILTGVWIAYAINLSTMKVTGHDVKFELNWWLLCGAPLFELLIVVLAAMIPAERAARLDVSSALQYE